MKKFITALTAVLLAIPLTLGSGAAPRQVKAADSTIRPQGELIYYYREGDNQFDEQRILQQLLTKRSQLSYDSWNSIINEWRWIDNEMPIPSSAPEDNSINDDGTHAFVLLGGGLYSDGRLGEAGKGRCDLAYDCMMTYPNSKLYITGGATLKALQRKHTTEAKVMKDYLVNEKHLDASRIVLEQTAYNTVTNASNTLNMMYRNGDIKSVTVVSSDFHCRRGTLCFYAQSLFDSQYFGVPMITITGCAGFPDISGHETVYSEAASLAALAGYKIPSSLPSSKLQSLKITGDNVVSTGTVPSVTVKAVYSIDSYTLDVTDKAEITNIDPNTEGKQEITASFDDGTRGSATGTLEVNVVNPSMMPYVMYRVYNPNTGEHFFTNDADEKSHLVDLGWRNEGLAWFRSASTDRPVYRLYNKNGSEHHYTMSAEERDNLINAGWRDEGIGWYSEPETGVPVYRVYNPNAFSNNHHYTTDVSEYKHLISIGWRDEGICWYGIAQ